MDLHIARPPNQRVAVAIPTNGSSFGKKRTIKLLETRDGLVYFNLL